MPKADYTLGFFSIFVSIWNIALLCKLCFQDILVKTASAV